MQVFHRIDINIIATVLLVYVILISQKRLDYKLRINRIFFFTCVGVAVQLTIETITCLINGIPGTLVQVLANIFHVLLFAVAPLISFVWFILIRDIVTPYGRIKQKHVAILLVPVFGISLISVLSPWTGWIFNIGIDNVYGRGPLFWLAAVITYLYLALSLLIVVRNRKYIIRGELTFFLTASLLPIIGGIMQSVFYGVLLMWSLAAFALIVGFIYLQQRMVHIDSLTGCWTRESFLDALERRITFRPDARFAGIYVDIDDLKGINDRFGHFEGDEAIRTIVGAIKNRIGAKAIMARMGGDEFVIALNTDNIADVEATIADINASFGEINRSSGKAYSLKCSFGCEIYDKKYQGINAFLSHVDTLMYRQKHQDKHKENG